MKKILLNLLILFISFQIISAQAVVFFDDFESGLLTTQGWTTYELTGQVNNFALFDDGWEAVIEPGDPNENITAASSSWFIPNPPGGVADAWLVSPAINVQDNTYELEWFARARDIAFADGYEVRISSTGNTPADFTAAPVFTIAEENTNWTLRNVSLAAYSGQTIHIAFRNNSNDKDLLFIDDVLVTRNLDFDAGFTAANLSEYTSVPLSQVQTFFPSVSVGNFGINPLSNITVTTNILDGNDNVVYTASYNPVASLAVGQEAPFTDNGSGFTPNAEDFYLMESIVSVNENDLNSANDTSYTALLVDETLYARDFATLIGNDGVSRVISIGEETFGEVGNVFEIVNTAEVASITTFIDVELSIGDTLNARIYNFSGNNVGTEVAFVQKIISATDLPTNNGALVFDFNETLSAGEYLMTIEETFTVEMGMLFSDLIYTDNKIQLSLDGNPFEDLDASTGGAFRIVPLIRVNIVPPQSCEITNISAGTQTACNVADNTYTQQVTVTYSNPPASGQLSVNGQNFNITSSTQTVTLTGLDSDGVSVNVTASFTADASCTLTSNNLFTAPASCAVVPCEITDVTAGSQTACNVADNSYTQQVTVTYSNPPASGQLSVNGQNFNITSSPQTVTLTGLDSDGASVNVTASFTADASCTLTSNNLFTAPASCQCPTINYSVSTEDDVCDQNTGCINVTGVSGGATPYTYSLDGGTSQSSGEFCSLASGSYDITIIDDNGCTNDIAVNIGEPNALSASIVNVQNASSATATDGSATVNVVGGTAPYDYVWTPSNETNASASQLSVGTNTVVVTDANNCSISREVEISLTNSIQDLRLEDLKLFPVPASEQVTLQFNTTEQEISFKVVNTLGATMFAENIVTKSGVFTETLNVSNFASGVYFIHLVGKDKASSLSFVINR